MIDSIVLGTLIGGIAGYGIYRLIRKDKVKTKVYDKEESVSPFNTPIYYPADKPYVAPTFDRPTTKKDKTLSSSGNDDSTYRNSYDLSSTPLSIEIGSSYTPDYGSSSFDSSPSYDSSCSFDGGGGSSGGGGADASW